eukprot:8673958-Pyramimonas_sp.AAC.1
MPPVPRRDDSGRWHIQHGPLDLVTGGIYADGACRKVWYWLEANRAGWGFIKYSMRDISSYLYMGHYLDPFRVHPELSYMRPCKFYRFVFCPCMCTLISTASSRASSSVLGLAVVPGARILTGRPSGGI